MLILELLLRLSLSFAVESDISPVEFCPVHPRPESPPHRCSTTLLLDFLKLNGMHDRCKYSLDLCRDLLDQSSQSELAIVRHTFSLAILKSSYCSAKLRQWS